MNVAGHRDGAALVCGIDDPVERLGGVLAGGQHPNVINLSGVDREYGLFSQVRTLWTRP
jgi:hypothetical protein